MTKTGPAAEHASARAFNDHHTLRTPVRYWKGVREGDGKVARTRTEAQLLSGHTAVIWLEGVSGCIALTHIQPITEEELAAAERIPAPRPVPTTRDRLRPTPHLDAVKAERDEALEARDVLRQQLDTARAELGSAQELLAVVDDVTEQLDRARARYATRPEVTPVEAAGDDQAEEDDLRSPLAAERDRLVETIGRLVSLPPEQIAKMHKVGYSGMSAGLGSPAPRAQEIRGEHGPEIPAEQLPAGAKVGYEVIASALHRDGLGALVTGAVVASAISTRPTLAEAVDELRRAIGPAEQAEG